MDSFEATTIPFKKGRSCGILVKDGISKSYNGLELRDSRPFEGVNVANLPALRINVSGRTTVGTPILITNHTVQWPGYPPWVGDVGRTSNGLRVKP